MELKLFFIIFEVFFKCQKQSITILTFKQASTTCRQIIHILLNQGIMDIVPCVK